jgi:hypothetical protein
LQTFSQLCHFNFTTRLIEVHMVPWTIIDQPRFSYRGLLIGELFSAVLFCNMFSLLLMYMSFKAPAEGFIPCTSFWFDKVGNYYWRFWWEESLLHLKWVWRAIPSWHRATWKAWCPIVWSILFLYLKSTLYFQILMCLSDLQVEFVQIHQDTISQCQWLRK